jgi:hypothetical protein
VKRRQCACVKEFVGQCDLAKARADALPHQQRADRFAEAANDRMIFGDNDRAV